MRKLFLILISVVIASFMPSCIMDNPDEGLCNNNELDPGEYDVDCGPDCEDCDLYFTIQTNFSSDAGFQTNPESLGASWLSSVSGTEVGFSDYCNFSLGSNELSSLEDIMGPAVYLTMNNDLTEIDGLMWSPMNGNEPSTYDLGPHYDCNQWLYYEDGCNDYETFTGSSNVVITENDNFVGGYIAGTFSSILGGTHNEIFSCPYCTYQYLFSGSFRVKIVD
jgi:hypothetical protein